MLKTDSTWAELIRESLKRVTMVESNQSPMKLSERNIRSLHKKSICSNDMHNSIIVLRNYVGFKTCLKPLQGRCCTLGQYLGFIFLCEQDYIL